MNLLKEYFNEHLPSIESQIQKLVNQMEPMVIPIISHILQAGGKRLRPMLCILTGGALGYHKKDIYAMACVLEFIHSATLLHDDILDNAILRRGRKAAHTIFGITETILAGDALLAISNKIISEYGKISLLKGLSNAIYYTACGEIQELSLIKRPFLSREEYLDIITGKTAHLIQFSCESGAILAEASEEMRRHAREFGLNLGVAFQLVDDVLDYAFYSKELGKPLGGDLREGKLTLPLILYLESLPLKEQESLLPKIKEQTLSREEQEKIITEINEKSICEQALEDSRKFLQKARNALSYFPSSREKEVLHEVIDFVRKRKK